MRQIERALQWENYRVGFAFSRNATIPPLQIEIGTTIHAKRIFLAADRCQEQKIARLKDLACAL